MKGIMGVARMVPEVDPLDVTIRVELEKTPGCLPTPAVGPNMMTVSIEGGSKLDEESDEPEEELVWGLVGL